MPSDFYSRLKAIRKYSALSIFAYILIPMLLFFWVSSVIHMKFCAAAVFSLLVVIVIATVAERIGCADGVAVGVFGSFPKFV